MLIFFIFFNDFSTGTFLIWLLGNENTCVIGIFCHQAHYLRAKALCCAGRREEALQEYFICVALKPDWTSVKSEAQKVIFYLLYHISLTVLDFFFINVKLAYIYISSNSRLLEDQYFLPVNTWEWKSACLEFLLSRMALGDEALCLT